MTCRAIPSQPKLATKDSFPTHFRLELPIQILDSKVQPRQSRRHISRPDLTDQALHEAASSGRNTIRPFARSGILFAVQHCMGEGVRFEVGVKKGGVLCVYGFVSFTVRARGGNRDERVYGSSAGLAAGGASEGMRGDSYSSQAAFRILPLRPAERLACERVRVLLQPSAAPPHEGCLRPHTLAAQEDLQPLVRAQQCCLHTPQLHSNRPNPIRRPFVLLARATDEPALLASCAS